jgi:hypothetical protein
MKTDCEDFEVLRRLMALKRHELPPPGYFNRLPGNIIARIERGEGSLSFWDRISANFMVRPAFAYAFALAACGALTASVYSVKTQSAETAYQPDSHNGWHSRSSGEAFASDFNPAQGPHVANWAGNTNTGVASPALFSSFAPPDEIVPVSYEKGN